ncbi:MAG TPA: response regulator [Actinomycetota bacterium]|nr:response regulator [Actinomycetota bacterium]
MARKRILLIDHRPEHMRQPVLRLQLEGYEVDEAPTGEAGLKMLTEGHHDLLLLDAELPGPEDGWEVLRKIRAEPGLDDLKVIVFMAPHGETGKLALLPVDAELRRPFPIGELLAKVRQVLGDR